MGVITRAMCDDVGGRHTIISVPPITRSDILEARHPNELYCADQSVHFSGHEQGKTVFLDEDISRPVA